MNSEPFQKLPKIAQWSALVAISLVMTILLKMAGLPAALMLGPMVAGIILETGGGKIRVARLPYSYAQAVIGCMIANVMTGDIIASFMHRWPLFVSVMIAIIMASCLLGFVISKLKIIPDTTAIWGLLPGAASVMMVMAEEFGADARLVAFIQYLRVVLVAFAAAIIARIWIHASGNSIPPTIWFPDIHWRAFGETLALIIVSVAIGPRLRIPAGIILLPLIGGSILNISHVIELQLPPWLLAFSYLMLGWSIGLRFTRKILAHAARSLPQIIISILMLMAFCGLMAYLLVHVAGIDLLTAYLATSPGGIDSAAIIAASTRVDMPFVMALQLVRLIFVLLLGPPVSRWVAGKVSAKG